jgi:23S rRNA pseudouridine1911/1915/1917 synthase
MRKRLELVAGPDDAGTRLDLFLAGHPEVGSRAAAQRLIAAGAVTVDGQPRAKRHAVASGERVLAELPEIEAPEEGPQAEFAVAYEDEHLIVVDKPAGLVVHPARGHETGTLAQALAARGAAGGEPWRPGIVHRLDRDTSGLLVVAKSEPVHRALRELIRKRQMRREYAALVEGRPDARSGTIDAAIGRDPRRRTEMSTASDRGRSARTHFEIAESFRDTTLLRVWLETGRTHQIRAHLKAIGHPVCGDPQYGGGECGRRLGLTRQFLHSAELRFEHPASGQCVLCESKLPMDLRRALDAAAWEPVSEGPDGD